MQSKTKPRSSPQNRKLHALCGDVVRQHPLIPYRRAFATEAWKRLFIQLYVREARWEAYHAGRPDPFPVSPVPSSELDAAQMSELIEAAQAWCALHGIQLSK